MAYQPKSYRKFLAASVSAVVAASAIAPVAASAASNNFKDVQAGTELADAVNYLVSTGTTNGESATEFGVHHDITRAQAAKMIAGVMGLDTKNVKDPGFPDVSKDNYYYSYIAAAANAGVFQGDGAGKFNPDKTITRAEAAKVFVKAFGLELKADAKTPFTDVPDASDANLGWATPYINTLYAAGLVKGTNDAGTTFEPNANLERGAFALLAYRVHNYLEELKAAPAVTSVSAINAKSVKITFNVKMDKTTAENAANYVVDINQDNSYAAANGERLDKIATDASATLSDDGKSVTLHFGAAQFSKNNQWSKLTISGLKAANGKTLDTYEQSFLVADSTPASLTSASLTSSTNLRLKFSEEVQSIDEVRIDGNIVNPTPTASGKNYVDVDITGLSLADGSHTVSVTGTKDLFSNVSNTLEATFEVGTDTVAPTVQSLTVVGENKVKVVFSEPLASAPVLNIGGADVTATLDGNDSSNKTYVADFSGQLDFTSNSFYNKTVTVKAGYKDVFNNTGKEYTKAVTFTKDTVKPVAQSIIAKDGHFIVKFSEDLDNTSVGTGNLVHVAFTDSDGIVHVPVDIDASNVKVGYDANGDGTLENNYIDIDATASSLVSGAGQFNKGTYKVTLDSKLVKDTASVQNENDLATLTYSEDGSSASDSTAPTVSAPTLVPSGTNVYQVVYSEEMGNSAIDVANYKIGGLALPAGSIAYFYGDKKTVRIELPKNSFATTGTRTFSVSSNVKDLAGNSVTGTTSFPVTIKDNTEATLKSVTVTSSSTLGLSFDELVTDSGAAASSDGFEVYVNGTKLASTAYVVDADDTGATTAILTLSGTTVSNTDTIQIKVIEGSSVVKDIAGNTLKAVTVNK